MLGCLRGTIRMIQGFESHGQLIIWLTLMVIGALLWEINKRDAKRGLDKK